MNYPESPTPCAGKTDLFTSTHPEAHALAAQLCAVCPVLTLCAEQTEALRRRPGSYMEGTWAGRLFKTRPFTDRRPESRKPSAPADLPLF